MKRVDAAASLFLALGVLALTGCESSVLQVPFINLDPINTGGRDGGGKPIDYAALMRIGAAAHAGGDLAAAVGIYRRAQALEPTNPAPFVGAGNTLLEMGEIDEAAAAFNAALARSENDADALRGLARAYLMTGRPELAGQPLSIAYQNAPDDPKLLQLIGVADDFVGQHEEAQARYRRALELLPHDRALSLNLALSLALTGNFADAVALLQPIATMPGATPRERLTLALIYGLQGDRRAAEHMARLDLDAAAVQRNLAYYDTLRRLSPDARQRAIQRLSTQTAQSRQS
jgi:Flp pilus assembly protein TadD